MKTKLANLIKEKRKALKMSQKELAEGICTQTIISRLEKEQVTPSVDIFFKIVKKLNISIEEVAELFDIKSNYINTPFISNEIEELIYKRDDKTLNIILKTIDFSKLTIEEQLFYECISATLIYHIERDLDLAIDKLESILEKVEIGSILYCRVISSIANFYTEKKDFKTAIKYFEILFPYLSLIENSDFESVFYYGIARAYGMNNQLDEGMKWNSLAITKLLENKSFRFLGDNYFLQAHILEKQNLISNAIDSCNKAINIFTLENDEMMKALSLSYLSNLKEKLYDEKN